MQQVISPPLGSSVAMVDPVDPIDPLAPRAGAKSAASWPAILAGAFVAISTSLVLLALGSGFGLAIVSPWPGRGVSATGFTINAAISLIVTQWISAALGGYIAGRLRTKWIGTHTHEVFFRDTAHGLITWSVATVVVAIVLAGSAGSIVGGGLRGLAGAASAGIQGAASGLPGPMAGMGAPGGAMPGVPGGGPSTAMTYDIDKLFRSPTIAPGAMGGASGPGSAGSPGAPASAAAGAATGAGSIPGMDMSNDPRIEAVYIAFHAIANQSVADEDRAYLAQLVQAQTGISATDAQKRVDDFITTTLDAEKKARAAVDTARQGAAETSLYTGLAMLIGAFIASVSAALGGRLRDEHP